jgi:hypothetical protein
MPITLDGTGSISGLTATGISAVQNLPAGAVIQVVQGTYATAVSSSTNTAIPTGLTATITPKFATSKILVLINHPLNRKSADNAGNDISFWLYKNGSNLLQIATDLGFTNTATQLYLSFSYAYLDSPATTSATTYATYFSSFNSNAASVTVGLSSVTNTIILMEVAA